MRGRRYGRVIRTGLLAASALVAGACAHNDVLVFGTSTTIGLNLETGANQGSAPSIVVGYEREEAVWMPLLANGVDSQIAACRAVNGRSCPQPAQPRTGALGETMYQSTLRENGTVVRTDTYSVFASLGASFNGRANTGVEAGAGVAQFFATGNAALNITDNEALVTALKVSSSGASEAQARAVEAASANEAADSAFAGLTEAQLAAARDAADRERRLHMRRVDLVLACATSGDGTFRWDSIVDGLDATTYPPAAKLNLKLITSREALRGRLEMNQVLTSDAMTIGAAAPFNCPGG